jgi:hypothetical protein
MAAFVRGSGADAKKAEPACAGSALREKQKLIHSVGKALLEPVHAAFRVNEFRLPGKERMAVGAGVDVHFLDGGTRMDLVAACTADHRFVIFRMDIASHVKKTSCSIGSVVFKQTRLFSARLTFHIFRAQAQALTCRKRASQDKGGRSLRE